MLVVLFPLLLIGKFTVLGQGFEFNFNHLISIRYNLHEENDNCGSDESLVLELNAYYKQNFGLTSLAGYGTITLPLQPGESDLVVPTYVPISTAQTKETICQMHRYYMGTCLDEIRPFEPVPISNAEAEWVKGKNIKMFSRGGLTADTTGIIKIRVSVMQDYFDKSSKAKPNEAIGEVSFENQVRMRETVDEVLARIRKNKRERMARLRHALGDENDKAKK